ncbi:ABC transporter substrate-binding protein [Spirochaetia bacterium]|nr:ABC transporter substrate-binding protein [Spirochaetia bacterium]
MDFKHKAGKGTLRHLALNITNGLRCLNGMNPGGHTTLKYCLSSLMINRHVLLSQYAFLLLLALLSFAACSGKSGNTENASGEGGADTTGTPIITVSILPQTYFTRRIGSGRVRTLVLTGPGQSPHDYEPTPRQMAELAHSRVWILSGAEFEIGLRPKIETLFPGLRIVDGVEGVRFRTLEAHSDGDHGEEAHHDDSPARDRHTWLGEEPAKLMARRVRDALIALDGANRDFYTANCGALIADIDREFLRLRGELAMLRGTSVFVYHPAFGYFLDEFGITQAAVETGGKEPTPRLLAALIGKAKTERPAAIFVQAQFPVEAAATVAAAAGAELVTLDPLSPDWLENIRTMGEALRKAAGIDGSSAAGLFSAGDTETAGD